MNAPFPPRDARLHGLFETRVEGIAAPRLTATIAPSLSEDGITVGFCGHPYLADGAALQRATSTLLCKEYARRGKTMLADLHGAFALAVHDARRGEALIAIDRIGGRSLCYAAGEGVLRFGESADEVARERGNATGTSVELDAQAIFDYLYFHCIPGPSTVFHGVRRLLAGHAVLFTAGRSETFCYWQPTYSEERGGGLSALATTFRARVEAAVARSVEGAHKPGAFLSGGTDSSTVAGMLRKVIGSAPHTYSIGFDAEGFDEMHYARIAAKHFGTDHHEYYVTPGDLVASIPAIAANCDQPFGNSSVLPTYYCARMAEADGVDRMLGGDGGDELFGGNTRYAKQRVFDLFDQAPRVLQSTARALLGPAALGSVPLVRKAKSYVAQASVPMPDRMQTYNQLQRIGIAEIFEASFLARVDVERPMKEMRAWYARAQATSLVNRMLAFDLKYTLADNDLPKVSIACRAAGVDVAYPFLDDAVVEFANGLDTKLKLKGLRLRWFFKYALRDFLPREIIQKTKHGFGLPFGVWMQRDEGLRNLAYRSLDALAARGIVRGDFIGRLRADLVSDHATYYGELVWVLMMLEQWFDTHEPAGSMPLVVR